jgi:hypothetical protein
MMPVWVMAVALLLPVAAPAQGGMSERELVRRAKDAVRAAEGELNKARQKYAEGFPEEGEKAVADMMGLLEQAFSWLKETRRHPRRQPAGFKDMEVKLRVYIRRMEDLKTTVPLDERPPLEKAIERMAEINDALLEGLMSGKKKK